MPTTQLRDIAYGPHERNVLDAYLPGNTETPSPAVIYFHGGGYVNGDKRAVLSSKLMEECLTAGISLISANYRFITTSPFPAPMDDGTRAIQFVRHMAKEWHIDASRIASSGGSAGGHVALWNALKGDRSKPDSADPVERQSSAVSAFVGFVTQVSKDQRFYKDIYEGPHIQPNLLLYYGLGSLDELNEPDNLKLAERASAITYMSADAPPALMTYDLPLVGPYIPKEMTVGEVIHHPIHGYMLKQKYDELGKRFVLRHEGDPLREGEIAQFLLDSFA
ncbi:alpha/beta hydrolase [Paenibacillus cymbidii]|uniref:alpha/beta hydrolase n=1 Tax=Paenibacillus cymbidii TaxID=1639034 RepID=UPI0010802F6A|nr:alpha/beta hydrolase [Paenibacillus cymbidii]